LYSFPDIIRQITSCRVMWMEHVSRVREKRVLVANLEGRGPLGKPRRSREDGILMVVVESGWLAWSGFSWLRIGTGGGLLCTW
jgi:hypothetical protein